MGRIFSLSICGDVMCATDLLKSEITQTVEIYINNYGQFITLRRRIYLGFVCNWASVFGKGSMGFIRGRDSCLKKNCLFTNLTKIVEEKLVFCTLHSEKQSTFGDGLFLL